MFGAEHYVDDAEFFQEEPAEFYQDDSSAEFFQGDDEFYQEEPAAEFFQVKAPSKKAWTFLGIGLLGWIIILIIASIVYMKMNQKPGDMISTLEERLNLGNKFYYF